MRLVHFSLFLRASFHVLGLHARFSSPDGVKEAIVSLVVPADSLPRRYLDFLLGWILAGESFLGSSSKDFKLHIQ